MKSSWRPLPSSPGKKYAITKAMQVRIKPQTPSIPTTKREGASTPWRRCSSNKSFHQYNHTNHSLQSLDTLGNEDKRHTQNLLRNSWFNLLTTTKDVTIMKESRKIIRATDNEEREKDDNQSPPFWFLQRFLQPELTNQTCEKNDGTTNHLPNGNRNP